MEDGGGGSRIYITTEPAHLACCWKTEKQQKKEKKEDREDGGAGVDIKRKMRTEEWSGRRDEEEEDEWLGEE